MMPGPVVVIQGDPDSDPNPFCQARAAADADGAKKGGYQIRQIRVAELDSPRVRQDGLTEAGQRSGGPR